VHCPQCQIPNRDGRRFCAQCGAELLAPGCPSCGFVNDSEDRFCGGCGRQLEAITLPSPLHAHFASLQSYTPRHLADRILTSRFTLEGEHKQVTVLFCDLAQSTMLADRLGARAMHTLLTRFFELALSQVHHYEGTINQFLGDGFMALFGAPLAHEDHARRAALAALGIQQQVGPIQTDLARQYGVAFAVRMGLNTGSVVVGSIGDNLRMDYTAIGDTTNLAARMQQLALPGTIYVTEATYRDVKERFQWRARGPQTVKGKTAPLPVYELLGERDVKSPFDVAAQRGLTRFVGRYPELHQLLALWEQAKGGQGQVVSVVGEAGIGKSRLAYELKARLAQDDTRYIEGSCFTYGEVISYLPFLEIVRAFCALEGRSTAAEVKQQIGQRLAALQLDPAPVAPYLQNLFAVPVEDEQFAKLTGQVIRQRTVEALTTLVVAEARHQPCVLILEDVHWIDTASEGVLMALVEAMLAVPLLLVLVYRPEYLQAWTEKAHHTQIALGRLPSASSVEMVRSILTKPYATRVALEPLSPAQSTALAQDLLGTATIPTELEYLITTKTDGNPLFVEELTRSLMESGDLARQSGHYVFTRPLEALDIPATVQGVLLARIDRLHDELKEVLRVASVIGRVFHHPLLAHVLGTMRDVAVSGPWLDEVLRHLEELEFVYLTSVSPQREYSFKHVLTQEAVYSTVLGPRQEEYHARIGQAYEVLYPDHLEEYYELLAYHYTHSGKKDKAVAYLDLASQKAAKANAMEESKAYFDTAMQILDTLPDTEEHQRRRISLLVNQYIVMLLLYKCVEYYELAIRYEPMAVRLGDPRLLGAFYGRLGHCEYSVDGRFDQSIELLTKAAALCEASGSAEDAGMAYTALIWDYLLKGNYEQAVALKAQVLRKNEQHFSPRWYAWAFAGTCLAYAQMGRWEPAVADGEQELRIAEEFSDNSAISFAAWNLAMVYVYKGDPMRAIEYGELGVEKAPTPGDKVWAQGALACAWCRYGEPRKGFEILTQVVAISRATRFRPPEIFTLFLGEGYWRAGEYDNAWHTLTACLDVVEPCGARFYTGSAYRLLGELALESNPAQAREPLAAPYFEQSITILRDINAENELALAYAGYGRLQKHRGEQVHAEASLTQALAIFERLGTLREPTKVRQLLTELASGSKRNRKAERAGP
jgi:class 3 adenylate cyclase/tetratricopeptide (TPR) repeat protein